MEQEQKKEWLTPPEAAAYLGIPEHRLARLRRLGRIKGIEGGGEHTRYSMYHISWLQNVDTSDKRYGKKKDEQGGQDEPDEGRYHSRSITLRIA